MTLKHLRRAIAPAGRHFAQLIWAANEVLNPKASGSISETVTTHFTRNCH